MGIYLPNIEMPKDRGVYIAIDIDGQVYTKSLGALEWRCLEQKAVPIPPHGRCVDVDALAKSDRMVGKLMMYSGEYVYTQSEIDRAPTIIPATK